MGCLTGGQATGNRSGHGATSPDGPVTEEGPGWGMGARPGRTFRFVGAIVPWRKLFPNLRARGNALDFAVQLCCIAFARASDTGQKEQP